MSDISSHEQHQEDGGEGQPQVSLITVKWGCLRPLESQLTVKHSNLADWMMNWSGTGRINYGPRPTSTSRHYTYEEFSQAFPIFHRSSTSAYYCQCKPKTG